MTTVLVGATLVLPDRVLSPGTLVLEGDRIIGVSPTQGGRGTTTGVPLHGHVIVPGFIDAHVHGLCGVDTLAGPGAIGRIAALLPRHGVAAFSPTSIACSPPMLRRFLEDVRNARVQGIGRGARVLPAHLESNFLNPDYAGAQPIGCLRSPRAALDRLHARSQTAGRPVPNAPEIGGRSAQEESDGDAILEAIAGFAAEVGTVTIASELDGGIDLVQWLVAGGSRVSLGHSGATYDDALAAVRAGASGVTHLFNRMSPLDHRRPGLAGAALQASELAVEVIGDGVHVHPALIRLAVAAKGTGGVLAISDGTAAAGLPVGARAALGDRTISVGATAALLADGTLAGSTATMDRVFRTLVDVVGLSLNEAASLCATTPARALGLRAQGVLTEGAVADVTVLGPDLTVAQTYIGGQLAWPERAF